MDRTSLPLVATAALFTSVVLMIAAEMVIDRLRRRRVDVRDSVNSMTIGLGYLGVKVIAGKALAFASFLWVYDHFRLFTLDIGNPLHWLLAWASRRLRVLLGPPRRAPHPRVVVHPPRAPQLDRVLVHHRRAHAVDRGAVQTAHRIVGAAARCAPGHGRGHGRHRADVGPAVSHEADRQAARGSMRSSSRRRTTACTTRATVSTSTATSVGPR